MRTFAGSRPQNQHPDALIAARRAAAEQNREAVRVTVQAMRRRGEDASKMTVAAVAAESGVSAATIYRRDDLFALVRSANPALQRRRKEQVYREQVARVTRELEEARAEASYQARLSGAAATHDRRLQQETIRLRRRILELERQVTQLEARLSKRESDSEQDARTVAGRSDVATLHLIPHGGGDADGDV